MRVLQVSLAQLIHSSAWLWCSVLCGACLAFTLVHGTLVLSIRFVECLLVTTWHTHSFPAVSLLNVEASTRFRFEDYLVLQCCLGGAVYIAFGLCHSF